MQTVRQQWAHGPSLQCSCLQAEFARVPLADTTVLPVPENISDTEALMLGDILPTGGAPAALLY